MTEQSMMDVPSEVNEMPEGVRNVFMAAFKSSQDNGMDRDAALKVAWNTVNYDFEKNEQGQWVLAGKAQDPGIHYKAVTSGGN
ncbi:MAG: ChaB family protein [Leptolyngbyaceae cyanobacterium bins.59]|nr:ChaB family protein [Leptolyngbyaceae cyanobacterium bins.59]